MVRREPCSEAPAWQNCPDHSHHSAPTSDNLPMTNLPASPQLLPVRTILKCEVRSIAFPRGLWPRACFNGHGQGVLPPLLYTRYPNTYAAYPQPAPKFAPTHEPLQHTFAPIFTLLQRLLAAKLRPLKRATIHSPPKSAPTHTLRPPLFIAC